ncbi:LysE family transporter [Paludibacterium denitrificans]|uniref:LysE family transporter n=1 Tax=Paludibacterium denitrificans TaxID=2675226 RepID=UPI002477CE5F|nr:LysE family transporter [Paludibacterium denitrificans]
MPQGRYRFIFLDTNMDALLSLGGIVGILMLGTISPGPSFVMVARTAVAAGRAEGIAAALGMGLGGTVFTIAALVGLQALLLAVLNAVSGPETGWRALSGLSGYSHLAWSQPTAGNRQRQRGNAAG